MSISTLADIGSFSHLKAFIPNFFQTNKDCSSSNARVNGR